MLSSELISCLKYLALSEAEAARFLSKTPRSVRRWAEGSTKVPGPVERAFRAWRFLEDCGLAWRPDGIAGWELVQIRLFRHHAIWCAELIQTVENRGGPEVPWKVNLGGRTASQGQNQVHFRVLANESISDSCSFTWGDPSCDSKSRSLEDAFYSMAKATAKAGKGWSERPRTH
jgi:hypothetical protein